MREKRQPPKSIATLSEGEIHVWEIALDDPLGNPDNPLYEILSEDEKERAARLRFSEYRSRFITARGYLRRILGRYLETRPEEIVFAYNEHGKPGIPAERNRQKINFNLSHSGDIALCAVTTDREVGVDIEYVRHVTRSEKILERFFSPAETEYYLTCPAIMKDRSFMSLWTIKEAYSKAVGNGFTARLRELDLSPALTGVSPSRVSVSLRDGAEKWSIYTLTPSDEYAAALALRGEARDLIYFPVAFAQ